MSLKAFTNKKKRERQDIREGKKPLSDSLTYYLTKLDEGNGVEFSRLCTALPQFDESKIDDGLFELAYDGKVYQPRPEYYRLLD